MDKTPEERQSSRPLRNRKHEKFCQVLAKNPEANQSLAYKKVYPSVMESTAVVNASKLLSNTNIRDRVLSLMSRGGKNILEKVSDKVNEHIDGTNAPVSMDACKTVLRVAGALDEQKQDAQAFMPTQINIIIRQADKAT
jgi:hypothetical protein